MPNERLTLELLLQASGQDSVDRMTAAMNRFAAASEASVNVSNSGAANVKKIGDAFDHAVPQIAAASAAVRAFEGTLSVRAVERFLTSTLNLGGVLQKIFPVIGALAFIDVLVKGGEEVVKFYQKWDPVHQAQERAVELAKDLDKEIKQIGDSLAGLRFENLEKAVGKSASSAIQAQAGATAIQGGRNALGAIDIRIAEQQKIIDAGSATAAIDGSGQRSRNPELVRDAQGAAIEIKNLQSERFAAQLKLEKDIAEQSKMLMGGLEHQFDLTTEAQDKAASDAEAAASKLAEQRKRAQSVVDSETERAIKDPIARAFYSARSRVGTFDDPQSRGRVAQAGLSDIASAAQDVSRKAIEQENKGYADSVKEDAKYFEESLRAQTKQLEDQKTAADKIIAVQDALTKQNGASDVRNATGKGAFADRMTSLNSSLTDAQKISILNQNDLATAKAKYQIEKDTADGLLDEKARAEAFNKAEIDNEDELQKIKEQNIERITELQQKQPQGFKSEVGSAFDALMNNSFGGFLKSQALGIGRTITENGAAMAMPAIEKMIPHASGKMGDLLKSTPFGPDPLKSATDLNTAATIANTQALSLSKTGGGGGLPGFGGGSTSNPFVFSVADSGSGGLSDIGDGLPMSSGAYGATAASNSMGKVSMGSSSLGKNLGLGAAAAGGAFAAFSDFRSGGAKNDIAGVGAGLGSAAAVAAMIPGGQVVALGLGIASAATSLIAGLMPDPKKVREAAQQKAIEQGTYHAPTALNVSQDTSGNFSDFDAHGMVRSSSFRAVPQVTDPYTWWKGNTPYQVPGNVTSPYSTSQPAAPTTIIIQAADAQSFNDMANRNKAGLSDAIATHLQNGDSRLHGAIRSVAGV